MVCDAFVVIVVVLLIEALMKTTNPQIKSYVNRFSVSFVAESRYKSWKRRWFILNDNCLYYFEYTTDKEPRGIIPLENVKVDKSFSLENILELASTYFNVCRIKITVGFILLFRCVKSMIGVNRIASSCMHAAVLKSLKHAKRILMDGYDENQSFDLKKNAVFYLKKWIS